MPPTTQSAPAMEPLRCPRLSTSAPFILNEADAHFAQSPSLSFRQHWRETPEPGFQQGTVRIGWHDDRFLFLADLQDTHPQTRATARNERLWLLGDVLEVFAGVHGDPAYIECHTAPNGHILQLHWPSAEALAAANASPQGITPHLRIDDSATFLAEPTAIGWRVLGSIPASFLSPAHSGPLAGVTWDINFGRYDYAPDSTTYTLSSTSALTIPHFHRRAEWTRIRFVG